MDNAITPLDKATADLICGALFFGMRSCEYTTTPNMLIKKTKLLELQDITFLDNQHNLISHKHRNILTKAFCVVISFKSQKNGVIEEINYLRSNKRLCPVVIWARICQRIASYDNTTEKSTVNTVYLSSQKKLIRLKSSYIVKTLKSAVKIAGAKRLGLHLSSIGTHSIRTSFAMMLALRRYPDSTIMKKGRWKSNAFLLYIRTYVDQFGADCSADIAHEENNFSIVAGKCS